MIHDSPRCKTLSSPRVVPRIDIWVLNWQYFRTEISKGKVENIRVESLTQKKPGDLSQDGCHRSDKNTNEVSSLRATDESLSVPGTTFSNPKETVSEFSVRRGKESKNPS